MSAPDVEKALIDPPGAQQQEEGIAVPPYKRTDGTSVSEHTRRPPEKKGKRERLEEGNDEQQQPLASDQQEAPSSVPKINFRDYLEMPWSQQRTVIIDKALSNAPPGTAELVDSDRQANMNRVATAIGNNSAPSEGGEGEVTTFTESVKGYADFLAALDAAGDFTNEDKAAITRHAKSRKYHDKTENDNRNPGDIWGKEALVPHLYKAGLFNMAQDVQRGKYKF